jgi:hypothetical protein
MREVLRGLHERYRRPCLLCACESEKTCHRQLLANALAEERPNLDIRHLK